MDQFIYSILLQRSGKESEQTDSSFFAGLHAALGSELEREITESKKDAADTIQKSVANLRGGLAQFLSTPLKSDKDDIELLIRENLEHAASQLGKGKSLSTVRQSSFRVIEPQHVPLHRQLVGVVRRILKNGKTLLANAGVATGKNSGTLYYSSFMVDEFATVPLIKLKFDAFAEKNPDLEYAVINDSLSSTVFTIAYDNSATSHEVVMNFNAPDSIVEKLHTKRATLLEQFGVKNIRLAKRSFVMGFSSQFQLEFGVDVNKHPLGSIIMSLVGDDDDLEDALTTQGSLIVLEKIA
ncbi:MAG: hypothetical protein PHP42_00125 [Bacteroidota bacterium]|nr:hypothetical protein [Bacteroidota bacterium]